MTFLNRLLLAAAVLVPLAPALPAQAQDTTENARPIAIVAHRGGAMARPENTLPAFHHAVELGVEYLEFDMVMTADDRLVVYHDGTINPDFCVPDAGSSVTAGPVRDMSLAEVRQFECGSRVRAAYAKDGFVASPGARIPELNEVLEATKGSAARFFIETKVPKDADIDPVQFATLFEAAVREHGLEDRVILQSFDFRTIDALHAINPRIPTCLLGVPKLTRDYLPLLRQHNARCIVLSHNEVTAEEVQALQQAGVLVFSGVHDSAAEWRKYVDLGVDALFTNDPEPAIAFLKEAGLRD
ncbi:hypothetical protein GRI97_16965 [Altererythrobacter xixiisoli]|uniref:GP-PDE domain-containing protein n=1 Tax=Croceibacterium xixiisoli TaxID=1476466 RepID=A0A6I4TXF7_9SPHN|nr:glycerophosphodiester phosphodiesterase family protein [Croceibacterium xixiisoli]MXP00685.1 hypothetical protein [Croceibacterium xixiisoli]